MPKRIQFPLHEHLQKIPFLLPLDSSPQYLLLAIDLKYASITFHLKSKLLIIELENVAINVITLHCHLKPHDLPIVLGFDHEADSGDP